MATKFNTIAELAKSASNQVVSNSEEWHSFLDTVSRIYKYSFDDQLLIYAQRPEADACALIEIWNRLYCRVKRGSKGIALIENSVAGASRLKYVFDMADVYEANIHAVKPVKWIMDKSYYERVNGEISEKLEVSTNKDFVEGIFDISDKMSITYIEDNLDDIVNGLKTASTFADLDDLNLKVIFRETLSASTAYTILKRCGVDTVLYSERFETQEIASFNSVMSLSQLGAANSFITKNVLMEIEKLVKAIQKEIAKGENKEYNALKRQSENVHREFNNEGRAENEHYIQTERGLHDTEFDDGRGSDTDRKVWQSKKEISEGKQERLLYGDSTVGRTEPAFAGDRSAGKDEDRSNSGPGKSQKGHYGGTKAEGSDAVGSGNEYASDGGRRSSAERADLQLDENLRIDNTKHENDNIKNDGLLVWNEKKTSESVFLLGNSSEMKEELSKNNEYKESEKINYIIKNDNLGMGSHKEKFKANVKAIRCLKQIEAENKFAAADEQEVMAGYVGWGGLSQVFDKNKADWQEEYAELKELLTPDEYDAARASTLSAFYTQPKIIRAVYDALNEMGFKKGNILEPAMGPGNFFGMLPESMKESKLYGVEIDSISGRIAKQLYQKADITVAGFETTEFPDSFFDVAVGNVPFGQYKVYDKRYDRYNFLIHDYFFSKALDKIRPGGVIAFITSKGTMDKANGNIRKYIAQRADLLGAVRLPNNAFSSNAGAVVTSDIIFLKKRERMIDLEQDWQHIEKTPEGFILNSYFVEHSEMILGELALKTNQYGKEDTVYIAVQGKNLEDRLKTALRRISRNAGASFDAEAIFDIENSIENETAGAIIDADPNVRNFSYRIYEDKIYFRENSKMYLVMPSKTAEKRIRGMIEIRDCVRKLIDMQVEDDSDYEIKTEQKYLNLLYDRFSKKFELLNSRGNSMAFSDDASYPLLMSLEILDEKGELKGKADIFTKRTIKPKREILSVDTAAEALAVSIGEKAKVDIEYMAGLTGMDKAEIISELQGVIYEVPQLDQNNAEANFVTADEYLSGNVREKLRQAHVEAKTEPRFEINVKALKEALPKTIEASEIDVRLGAIWVPEDVINDFMYSVLETSWRCRQKIEVSYSDITNNWYISNKSYDSGNIKSTSAYGTSRINAYKIMEETLNLKDVRITDSIVDEEGKEKRVLNKKETTLAQQKQDLIKSAFSDWVWQDPERREKLVELYNERFNSIRPREYDGSHITFANMNQDISLKEHQVNAVARILYGGNTLLAHTVGAGKTFEMVAAAQESKRLGLCNKSLFVVPNHLTEQWAGEYLRLYPSANVLITTKKDFEKKKRRRFCSRIATGDYDAIIMGHSQFEKIPMSLERQEAQLNKQINEIVKGVYDAKRNSGDNITVKKLERVKKNLELKLKKLTDVERKDDIVTFEELGVDRIFVDEAHYFKNLFLYTKMRDVAGIAQTEANKSSDLYLKCRYLDEITENRGVIFATGTPISNSMTEMYTMQRYLQYDMLGTYGLEHFDAWASTFGETITAIELSPEGTGYRAKTRFAKFFNLPELMNMFREVADIKTADMLDLEVPEAEFNTVVLKPSEFQKEYVAQLSERADRVRNKVVEPTEDNMLKITNDGRKLALDERLIADNLPDMRSGKTSACSEKIFELWEHYREESLAQLVFCDLSTPHFDGSFNVYDDIKVKLMDKGVPEYEIAYIHDAKTDRKKDEIFAKVRNGSVRILLGSTQKMGAGTNVQDKLIAIHDLDCPWRPSDLEQRLGRIVRQGNKNKKVFVYRYVTENTFDSYLYQIVENKQKFIGQIMTSKSPVRSAEDIDEATLSYAEIKALATGNPLIKEKMDIEVTLGKLKVLRSGYLNNKYALEDAIRKRFPANISQVQEKLEKLKLDVDMVQKEVHVDTDKFSGMVIKDVYYDEKQKAGEALILCIESRKSLEESSIGSYRGFDMALSYSSWDKQWEIVLKRQLRYTVVMGSGVFGNITRLDNAILGLPEKQNKLEQKMEDLKHQLENAKIEVQKPFAEEEEFKVKTKRLAELDILLNLDEKAEEEPELQNIRSRLGQNVGLEMR